MKRGSKVIIVLVILLVFSYQMVMAESRVTEEKIQKIEEYVREHMEKFDIPGMALTIVDGRDVVYTKGFGVQKVGGNVPVDSKTNFGLASVSKPFTSLAIMQLRDRGLLNVDDPVVKYLPWFATKNKEQSDKITIKHLLQHQSGIPTQAYGLELKENTEADLEKQIRRIGEIELVSVPGEAFNYANFNYWTLALIVEKLSGMNFSDYMEENIFGPLEMDRSGYYNKVSDLDNLSPGHRFVYGKQKYFDYAVPPTTWAAGGVYSNAEDMGHFLIAILNDGSYRGKEIVSPESMDLMRYDKVQMAGEDDYGYGFLNVTLHGENWLGHPGDNPNYTAHIAYLPAGGVAFAILSNSQHRFTHALSEEMAAIFSNQEMTPHDITGMEVQLRTVNLIRWIGWAIIAIILLWVVYILIGMAKGKYVIRKQRPGWVRIIFQVVLIPVVGLVVMIFILNMPAQMIGSFRIAKLYQPDLVNSAIQAAVAFFILTLWIAFIAFIRKTTTKKIRPDQKA